MRFLLAGIAGSLLLFQTAAIAEGPEQLDQLEPGRNDWQVEYFATFGSADSDAHAAEAMVGLSERIAVGFELEAERNGHKLAFESFGPKLLYRLSREGALIAAGVQVQVGFDEAACLQEAEVRLIAEAETGKWWLQANAAVRRSVDEGPASTGLAYAWSVQHTLGDSGWIGAEGSGQAASIWQNADAQDSRGHFVGPSLTLELEPSLEHEVEIGLASLWKIVGDGSDQTLRIFVQVSF